MPVICQDRPLAATSIARNPDGSAFVCSIDIIDMTSHRERQGRRISVALMDATESRFTQIAPSQLLEDFGDGVYLTVSHIAPCCCLPWHSGALLQLFDELTERF